jgi:hypothetical protein
VEVVDIQEWAKSLTGAKLPVPIAAVIKNTVATLCGGHVCLILTPNGEIRFCRRSSIQLPGWPVAFDRRYGKIQCLGKGNGNAELAKRLFIIALNLAEDRQGALFVILDDAQMANRMLASSDLLIEQNSSTGGSDLAQTSSITFFAINVYST